MSWIQCRRAVWVPAFAGAYFLDDFSLVDCVFAPFLERIAASILYYKVPISHLVFCIFPAEIRTHGNCTVRAGGLVSFYAPWSEHVNQHPSAIWDLSATPRQRSTSAYHHGVVWSRADW